MTALYQLQAAGMRYGATRVLGDVTLSFSAGEFVALAGPNGAGKSTLLSIMAGLRHGHDGDCLFDGREARLTPRSTLARRVSFVPQSFRLEFPFTAEQVVLMGRTPHAGGMFESPRDKEVAEEMMRLTDTLPFLGRDFRSLSGGERQRIVLASALAQEPTALLLDEPTTFLDLRHQISIYALLKELSVRGILVIAATHDLNLAAAYSSRVVLLRSGRVEADGHPTAVFTQATLRQVFEVDAEVREGTRGRPWILYGA